MKPSVVWLLVVSCIFSAPSHAEITQTKDEDASTENEEHSLGTSLSKEPFIHQDEKHTDGSDLALTSIPKPASQDLQPLIEPHQLQASDSNAVGEEANVAKSREEPPLEEEPPMEYANEEEIEPPMVEEEMEPVQPAPPMYEEEYGGKGGDYGQEPEPEEENFGMMGAGEQPMGAGEQQAGAGFSPYESQEPWNPEPPPGGAQPPYDNGWPSPEVAPEPGYPPQVVPPQPEVQQPPMMSHDNAQQSPWVHGPEVVEQHHDTSHVAPGHHPEVSGPGMAHHTGFPNPHQPGMHEQEMGPHAQPHGEPSIIVDHTLFNSDSQGGMPHHGEALPAESFAHEPAWTAEEYHGAKEQPHGYHPSHGEGESHGFHPTSEKEDYFQLKEAADKNELLQKLDELENEVSSLQHEEQDQETLPFGKMKSESTYEGDYEESVGDEISAAVNTLCFLSMKTMVLVTAVLPVLLHIM
ncbi:hypothetical protein Bbelb_010610 [Branchiostoma belcheri]|nr:hypothetical protein Bbelb_010610 [Branchiostoma belcheri]